MMPGYCAQRLRYGYRNADTAGPCLLSIDFYLSFIIHIHCQVTAIFSSLCLSCDCTPSFVISSTARGNKVRDWDYA